MKLKKEAIKMLGKDYEQAINSMGFEIIGDIAILEIDLDDKKVLTKLADLVKKYHPVVGVVSRKISDIEGKFRIAKHEIIKIYDRTSYLSKLPLKYRNLLPTETVHYEHGCRFLLDIDKVYFSSKLGFERKRIMELSRDGENVAVLFAGIGPFAIVLAKYKKVFVDAVELNPYAVDYFKKNLDLNRLKGEVVRVYEADVGEWIKKHDLSKYDRIIMPAPKDAPTYLEQILKGTRKEAKLHYYFFADKNEIETKVNDLEKQYDVNVLFYRVAGSVGTNQYRVVVDLEKL